MSNLKLAQQNQQSYIEALYEYRNSSAPFQALHRNLAIKLNDYPNLIIKDCNNETSEDIFRNPNTCAKWKKV